MGEWCLLKNVQKHWYLQCFVTVMGLKLLFWSKNHSPMIMAGKPLLQLPGLMVSYTQNLSIPYIYAGLSLTSWTYNLHHLHGLHNLHRFHGLEGKNDSNINEKLRNYNNSNSTTKVYNKIIKIRMNILYKPNGDTDTRIWPICIEKHMNYQKQKIQINMKIQKRIITNNITWYIKSNAMIKKCTRRKER